MKSIIEYVTKYPIWANALIFVVLILGTVSVFTIKKSFFPEVEPNVISVAMVYPGASPEEMEEGVVLKVEEALKGIEGIEEITSVASENTARITVEVIPDFEAEIVLTDVKNAIDQINSFPENAEKPVIYNQKPRGDVIDMILVGGVDLMTLKWYAEGIREDLLNTGLITQIEVSGYPEREISIESSEETLLRFGLTFDQLADAVRLNNRDVSSGSIKSSSEEILIRSRAKRYDAEGIGQVIVRTNPDGSILRLADVAEIKEQFADVPNKTMYNGKPAVTIEVAKLPDDDILEIRDYVLGYTEDFNEANETVEIILDNDRSNYLLARLNILLNNGFIGLMLVLIFLGLFLNIRLSFWVAFGIPFSFLGMLFLAQMIGITINIISLFGMILVIGILVDDGIVVAENIYSHFEKGKSPLRATMDGTMEVLPAVFTGVSTTIVAFTAFFFLDGRFGSFIVEMAYVVIFCLALSLLECAFILPPHIAYSGALDKKEPGRFREWFDRNFRYARDRIYGGLLARVIRHRYITLSLAIAACMIMIGAIRGNYLKLTYFPSFSRSDNLDVNLVLRPGTREFITEDHLKQLEEKVWAFNEDQKAQRPDGKDLVISTRLRVGAAGDESGGNTGGIRVELLPEAERNMDKPVVARMLKKFLGEVPGAEQFTVGEGRRWFGSPVSMSLKSRNLADLEGAKNMVKTALSQRADLKDITDSNIPGKREINMQLKPLAYVLGLTHNDITRQIRQGFFGEEVQRLQIGQDEVRVWVRYPEASRRSLGQLEQVKIKTTDGSEYPLTDLVEYETVRGVISIKHLDGARENRVEAELANPRDAAAPILADLQENLVPEVKKAYPGVLVSFEGQARQGDRFGNSFALALPLIVFGIFMLISLEFRAFSQAFLIILMIPLGFLGAALGHLIEGKPLSILSSYGIVALTGVIVNDAVVFADKYNRLIKQGHTVASAIFYAGKSRFRPIILTSLTTVVGLFPLIRDTSATARFLVPMAISVAYGILFGTFLILTVFPALVVVWNDLRVGIKWIWDSAWNAKLQIPSRIEVEPAIKEDKRIERIL
ncbi:MAG: efflux RND transporter permease subunit [Bacteroidota bacterium]